MQDNLDRHCRKTALEILGQQREHDSQHGAGDGIEDEKKIHLDAHVATMAAVYEERRQEQCEQHRQRKPPDTPNKTLNHSAKR